MATALAPIKPRRKQVPEDKVLCDYCTAKCCRYFALPIETHRRLRRLRIHPLVLVTRPSDHVQGRRRLVSARPHHVRASASRQPCGIYETRPQVCRDYSTKDCEYDDDWTYDFYLETAEQVAEYTEAIFQGEGESIRSPKPPLLPILA